MFRIPRLAGLLLVGMTMISALGIAPLSTQHAAAETSVAARRPPSAITKVGISQTYYLEAATRRCDPDRPDPDPMMIVGVNVDGVFPNRVRMRFRIIADGEVLMTWEQHRGIYMGDGHRRGHIYLPCRVIRPVVLAGYGTGAHQLRLRIVRASWTRDGVTHPIKAGISTSMATSQTITRAHLEPPETVGSDTLIGGSLERWSQTPNGLRWVPWQAAGIDLTLRYNYDPATAETCATRRIEQQTSSDGSFLFSVDSAEFSDDPAADHLRLDGLATSVSSAFTGWHQEVDGQWTVSGSKSCRD